MTFRSSLGEILRRRRVRVRMKREHPTSIIHGGARIDVDSEIGDFNVLFPGVAMEKSRIGSHTYIQRNSTVVNADIGKYCSIAAGVFLGLPRHSMSGISSHPAFFLRNTPLAKTYCEADIFETSPRTFVGNDVWIGQNALVKAGIKVGTGAVIGAGAVVTRDVPDYAVVVGAPAKVVRYRFDPETIRSLLASKWWDLPEEWHERNHECFRDPARFIDRLKSEGII